MIEFFNQNQGAVSALSAVAIAILTLVYVGATVWLVRVSQRQADLAQKSIEVLGEAEHNRSRPYVVFDITYDGVVAFATLKNIGLSPALDVRITISPDLKWQGDEHGVGFIEHGMTFLAPNRELSEPCGAGKDFREKYPGLRFQGTVTYRGEKRIYEEPFTIDLRYASRMMSISKIDPDRELQRIAESLRAIASADFHPLVRVISEKDYPKYREEFLHRRSIAAFEHLMARAEAAKPAKDRTDSAQ